METGHIKVALIGAGMVGMSFAYTAIAQGVCTELVILDIDEEMAHGEALDLQHAVPFFSKNTTVYAGDYRNCTDVDVAVITAGKSQLPGESRLDLVQKNAEVMRSIITSLMASGFSGIIVVATNPVDVMSYIAMKASNLGPQKVFGSGTSLDSGRLRYALAEKLQVAPTSVHTYIIGEHGDSSLPTYSSSTIGGKPLLDFVEEGIISEEDLENAYTYVRDAAQEIIKRKKATYYGIGAALAKIVQAVVRDEKIVLPIGTYLDGEYGERDIYIGVPAVLGKDGVERIIEIPLSADEKERFSASCNILRSVMQTVV